MRTLFVWLSFASAGASRIAIHSQTQAETKFPFGASCEDLQNRFHNQVHTLRVAIDAPTSESVVTQARLAMRAHGMVRTLRRAQECDWVVENNSEDIEEMRGIMQDLLAGNPCADAARSELEAGASSEENAALGRAMLILMSDDCEVPEIQQPADDTQTPEANLQQAEEGLQDRIDEIMEAEDEEGESFIQSDQAGGLQRFMRGLGVFFLMIFLLLACVASVAAIVAVLAVSVAFIYMATYSLVAGFGMVSLTQATSGWGAIFLIGIGQLATAGSLPFGVVGCGYRLYNTTISIS